MDACITNMKPEFVPVEASGKAPTGSCESSSELLQLYEILHIHTAECTADEVSQVENAQELNLFICFYAVHPKIMKSENKYLVV